MDNLMMQAQLEYLQGQVTALQAAVRALICAQADPEAAMRMVSRQLEETQANGLASRSASEASLLGLDSSPDRLLPTRRQRLRAHDGEATGLPWR